MMFPLRLQEMSPKYSPFRPEIRLLKVAPCRSSFPRLGSRRLCRRCQLSLLVVEDSSSAILFRVHRKGRRTTHSGKQNSRPTPPRQAPTIRVPCALRQASEAKAWRKGYLNCRDHSFGGAKAWGSFAGTTQHHEQLTPSTASRRSLNSPTTPLNTWWSLVQPKP